MIVACFIFGFYLFVVDAACPGWSTSSFRAGRGAWHDMITETQTKNWYIVHTYSGFEERVRQNLRQRIEAMGMQEKFGEIRIPTETSSR